MFIDRVTIKLQAGNGGDGKVAFRREKYVPLGGPAGGDGGKGGSIIFVVDSNRSTLLDLRYNRHIKATSGGPGKIKKMHGSDGDDVIVKVPPGTLVKDVKTNAVIADLVNKGQKAVICKGGKGGRGNWHFATGRNTAPEFCENGEPGETKEIEVELKVLADVGLVGFPSVGKSTLLSVVTKAKPEIADYHFTTLAPNLGVVQVKDGRSFVMADLPGLIKGASDGKGLGHQFLKHIERCRVILHVIDMGAEDGRDPIEDYKVINEELKNYQLRLSERPQVVLANKMDMDDAKDNLAKFKEAYPDIEVFEGITLINEGLESTLYRLADLLEQTDPFPLIDEDNKDETGVVYKFVPKEIPFKVINEGNGIWHLDGELVERYVKQTNLASEEATIRLAGRLRKLGVDEALRKAGCQNGDTVFIKNFGFEFIED